MEKIYSFIHPMNQLLYPVHPVHPCLNLLCGDLTDAHSRLVLLSKANRNSCLLRPSSGVMYHRFLNHIKHLHERFCQK